MTAQKMLEARGRGSWPCLKWLHTSPIGTWKRATAGLLTNQGSGQDTSRDISRNTKGEVGWLNIAWVSEAPQ